MARMKSLKRDANDWNQLQWSRFKNQGACVASEYYQNCPYFFTREGSQLNMVGMYRGGAAFLIAGGPSFNLVDKAKLAKAPVFTMTLNNSCRTFRPNAGIIVDDPCRFIASLWLDPKIMKFVPMSAFEKPLWDNRTLVARDGTKNFHFEPMNMKVGDCPNVIGYRRNEKFVAARFLYEDTINWGCHKDFGGGRSVMLAATRILFLLGFRRLYLLGVDFEMSDDKKYHFNEGRTDAAVRGNMSTYSKMIKWFGELQPHFLAENFIVKNCNPNSRLTAFPKIDFEEAVYEASHHVGDLDSERTEGMYVKYEEKVAAWKAARAPARAEETSLGIRPSPDVSPDGGVMHPPPITDETLKRLEEMRNKGDEQEALSVPPDPPDAPAVPVAEPPKQ
jgi:hypothetical protein